MNRARARAAQELHELLGRVVASTALALDACAQRATAGDQTLRLRLEQARADTDRTVERIRDLLDGLNLGDPAGPGLPARVKRLIDDRGALAELRAACGLESAATRESAPSAVREGGNGPALRLPDIDISILQLLAQGLSNKQIGVRVQLSPYTIKDHLKKIAAGLSVRSRTAIVAEALRRGLL